MPRKCETLIGTLRGPHLQIGPEAPEVQGHKALANNKIAITGKKHPEDKLNEDSQDHILHMLGMGVL
jgi:hypothetical protein